MSNPVFFVKSDISGRDLKTLFIGHDGAATIAAVKAAIFDITGVPTSVQRLRFQEIDLDDSENLGFYGIDPDETVVLSLHTGTFDYDTARTNVVPDLVQPDQSGSHCAHLAPGTGIRQRIRNLAPGSCILGFSATGIVSYSVRFVSDGGASLRVIEGTTGVDPGGASTEEVDATSSAMTAYEVHCDAPAGTHSVVLEFAAGPLQAVLLDQVSFRGRTRQRIGSSGEDSALPDTI